MTILQILPELKVGGVETGVVDLSKGLAARGHKAIIVSAGGPLVERLEKAGAKHYQLPVHKKSLFAIFWSIKRLKGIIAEEEPDIVHAQSRVPAIIGYFASRGRNTSFITTCHGYYNTHIFSRPMGWGKLVIVISSIIGRHMVEGFNVPIEKIRYIPRGVDLERFKFKLPQKEEKKEYIIGMIGRITPLKGHAFFIKAMSKVVRRFPKLKIWIVGDAPSGKPKCREGLELLVRRLGLSRYVEFLGNREDLPEILAKLDLLVLATTQQEAFGRVIIEAYAAGVPVVATRVGGVVDVVEDEKTGLLVSPEDPDALAEAVTTLLKDRDKAHFFAKNARKKVEAEFALDKMVERTIQVYDEARKTKRLLVIKLSAAGDVILAIPSIRAIRSEFPEGRLAVLVSQAMSQIVQSCPYVDEVIIYDTRHGAKSLPHLFRLGARLREHGFDMVIDLQNNLKSHLLGFLSLAPKRVGYHNGKLSFLLNYRVPDTQLPMPPVNHQFRVLSLAGVKPGSDALELWPSADDERYIDEFLCKHWIGKKGLLIGVALSSGTKWQTKRWPSENCARLVDLLSRDLRARVVVTGSKEDLEALEDFNALTKSKPVIAVGKTSLMQLASLIKRCEVFVTSDSAPMHIAASVGTPFVALFGPTDPRRHLPPAQRLAVINKKMRCSPCYKDTCPTRLCMKKITVDEVAEAVKGLLGKSKG